ncbi:MAG: nucleotidyltransferase substrate binding protein [Parachlamydiaceae bacterium]
MIKEAFKNGLILEGQIWIDMLDQRNELTHRYKEINSQVPT